MKIDYLYSIVTEKVIEYANEGYVLNVKGGRYLCSSFEGQYVMTKGNEHIVIGIVHDDIEFDIPRKHQRYGYRAVVYRGHRSPFNSVYADEDSGRIYESEPLFSARSSYGDEKDWFVAKEEMLKIIERRQEKNKLLFDCFERDREKSFERNVTNELEIVRIIHYWLRKQPRMKSCHIEDIERIVRSKDENSGKFQYRVLAKGRNFLIKR